MMLKLLIVIATIVSLLVLENQFPYFKFSNSLWARIVSNFELGGLNTIISSLFTLALVQYPITTLPHQGILTTIPVIIAGIVSILILDMYMYAWHRLMHYLPIAWRFHRVHHTDRSMNVSTAYRFHAIEIISSSIPKLILIWWLGISSNLVLIYELVFTVIVALHHSNLAIPSLVDRSLAYIIVTPNCHRIHHSEIVTETNSNYGSVLIWWDWIFHTNSYRRDVRNIQLGISEEPRDLNMEQLIKLPFGRE